MRSVLDHQSSTLHKNANICSMTRIYIETPPVNLRFKMSTSSEAISHSLTSKPKKAVRKEIAPSFGNAQNSYLGMLEVLPLCQSKYRSFRGSSECKAHASFEMQKEKKFYRRAVRTQTAVLASLDCFRHALIDFANCEKGAGWFRQKGPHAALVRFVCFSQEGGAPQVAHSVTQAVIVQQQHLAIVLIFSNLPAAAAKGALCRTASVPT